jgi:large subunit ribosomal protein L22
MQVISTYRFARISAFKAREVTREIQGRSASDALDILAFSPRKAALLVKKTLRSAIANAENNAELKVDTLLVKEAVVGEGPTFKRFRARARGSASPLRKRTSHIRIILTDDLVPAARTPRSKHPAKASESKTQPPRKQKKTTEPRVADTESMRKPGAQKSAKSAKAPVAEAKPEEEEK